MYFMLSLLRTWLFVCAYEVNTINNTHTLTRTNPHKHVQRTVSFNLIKTELN